MVIVTLEDTTSYMIDTDLEYVARRVVEYKLKDRMDFRKIESCTILEDTSINKNSSRYNSADYRDGIPLKCKTGWSYKWGDRNAEFR